MLESPTIFNIMSNSLVNLAIGLLIPPPWLNFRYVEICGIIRAHKITCNKLCEYHFIWITHLCKVMFLFFRPSLISWLVTLLIRTSQMENSLILRLRGIHNSIINHLFVLIPICVLSFILVIVAIILTLVIVVSSFCQNALLSQNILNYKSNYNNGIKGLENHLLNSILHLKNHGTN